MTEHTFPFNHPAHPYTRIFLSLVGLTMRACNIKIFTGRDVLEARNVV
jgi:hypothetical protein